ncbi:hypothetical protein NEF87_002055 [Candidatus Lokiarchaeum ossiferum]|uniref:Uncharacterized protein n=1 Tax=Candidatus Lokiarchaeum ossiferum TaxID=2951803 RepID=A0ABY6HQV0_9ARCH|nr:hypothetical protein NEF87_002055 [Candidatus Lokiarchaeum sp. B-35]
MCYYEKIVQEFQSQCLEQMTGDYVKFVSEQIITLMKELKEAEQNNLPNLTMIREDITHNLVLLNIMLKSTEDPDYYKQSNQLSNCERDFLRNEFIPLIFNS